MGGGLMVWSGFASRLLLGWRCRLPRELLNMLPGFVDRVCFLDELVTFLVPFTRLLSIRRHLLHRLKCFFRRTILGRTPIRHFVSHFRSLNPIQAPPVPPSLDATFKAAYPRRKSHRHPHSSYLPPNSQPSSHTGPPSNSQSN